VFHDDRVRCTGRLRIFLYRFRPAWREATVALQEILPDGGRSREKTGSSKQSPREIPDFPENGNGRIVVFTGSGFMADYGNHF
jgi:hypothetical protein